MARRKPVGVPTSAIRGPVLAFTGDPFKKNLEEVMVYESDAIVAFGDGYITHFASANRIESQLPAGLKVKNYGPDALISAGFINSSTHLSQIAASRELRRGGLNNDCFPLEQRFADKAFARSAAKVFLQESLKNGITTNCSSCTVFSQSVDALFEEAERLGMRIAAGKVMTGREAPDCMPDTPKKSYDRSKALLVKWHGRNRLMYAVTPRFAHSTPELLEAAGALCSEHPECYMQTHIFEELNDAGAAAAEPLTDRHNRLAAWDRHNLCRPRAIFGNGLYLGEEELLAIHRTGSAVSHCPPANCFPGKSFFHGKSRNQNGPFLRMSLGTGMGTASFSMLQSMNRVQKAAYLGNYALTAGQAFYMATLGAANAMYIDDWVGSIAVGMEADLVVLNMKSTPLIEYRMQFAENICDGLSIQVAMGDDRAVQATYVAGVLQYSKEKH